MKIIFAIPETVVCASFAIAGIYMLHEGMTDKSANATVLLIAGAAVLAFGIVTLQTTVRSILWHRQMLRRAATRRAEPTHPVATGHD